VITITILGSGVGIPSRTRAGPGWVATVEAPEADAVLVDPSAGSIQRMAERGIPLDRLTHVLLSHFHPDHTGDLAPLLFALKSPRYAGRSPPLTLIGPRGLRKLLRDLEGVYGQAIESARNLQVVELGSGERERFAAVGPLDVTAFPVVHAEGSIAYRFSRRGGPTFAYTGDTDHCDGAVEAGRGADLLLIECSYPEGEKRAGHLTPSEVGRIAAAAGPSRVVLLHLYPECRGHDLITPCRKYFAGEVTLAEDGMTIPLPEGPTAAP
jgi:ribonuclease BN (tRNA processing enzyme)